MRPALFLLAAIAVLPAQAQVVAAHGRNIFVAHEGRAGLHDSAGRKIWSAEGVDAPSHIALSSNRAAILDAWSNRVRLIDLGTGAGLTVATAETPVEAVFADGALFVLCRDSSVLQRIDGGGRITSVAVDDDPLFVRERGGMLYVYSRRQGVLQEITPRLERRRRIGVAPFASDLEIAGSNAYLLFPRDARLMVVDLETMTVRHRASIGAVPSDLAVAGSSTALSAVRLAIADPAAKRIWRTEGAQSTAAAFGRGFLRGLLGLGLYRPANADFPTGVDRVMSSDGITLAFDSTTGTLFRAGGEKPRPLAQLLGPQAFAIADGTVAFWQNGRLHLLR
jgi:hypothetical protein